MILAGDIGGTKTVVGLYEKTGGGLREVGQRTFHSGAYASLEPILEEFLKDHPGKRPDTACFGIAGAVIEGSVRPINLGWTVSETSLAQAIGLSRVRIINDLQAAAYGMMYLRPDELAVLNTGGPRSHQRNIAVLAAGTGLGEAMLYWDGARYHPIATEGGHADFAPRGEREIELLRYLEKQYLHVSNERLLSGPGFYHIYCFLRDTGFAAEPDWLKEQLATGDPSAIISEVGLAGRSPLCEETLAMFASIYGSEAGNMALRTLAFGGVYVAGGIAPKILKVLREGHFMKSFVDKGRFKEMLAAIEVSVALNPLAPLIGAANFALTL